MSKLEILYISSSCSREKNRWLFSKCKSKKIEPQQKFNCLLIEGISKVPDIEVVALSSLPVSGSNCDILEFHFEKERVSESLSYWYLPFRNSRLLRFWDILKNSRRYTRQWLKDTEGKRRIVIADALDFFSTVGIIYMLRRFGVSSVALVTDLPYLTTSMKQRKEGRVKHFLLDFIQKCNHRIIKQYDAYITLTKSIFEKIEETQKPVLIVEGSVDSLQGYLKKDSYCSGSRVVVYAGGMYEKYGVKLLVDAFSGLRDIDAELHLYGDGSFVPQIEKLAMTSKLPIIYKGVVSLDDIVKVEGEATLLVNPRPTTEEFSKYSFPSKTLEYMLSGTPLLTTRLPGIPDEYFSYCYSFEEESVIGFRSTLDTILRKPYSELLDMGRSAFDFVSTKKNNIVQGEKIVSFLREIEK